MVTVVNANEVWFLVNSQIETSNDAFKWNNVISNQESGKYVTDFPLITLRVKRNQNRKTIKTQNNISSRIWITVAFESNCFVSVCSYCIFYGISIVIVASENTICVTISFFTQFHKWFMPAISWLDTVFCRRNGKLCANSLKFRIAKVFKSFNLKHDFIRVTRFHNQFVERPTRNCQRSTINDR